jgi:ribosome maturation factor RimP
MMELIGKTVEVGTVETVYIGKLIEVNDEEVYLESESGWVVVPVDRVAYIREKED